MTLGPQFQTLYHFLPHIDDDIATSIRKNGLLPRSRITGVENESTDRVWAFDSPQGRGRPEAKVTFRVPVTDVEQRHDSEFGTVYSVNRPVSKREIVDIDPGDAPSPAMKRTMSSREGLRRRKIVYGGDPY